MSPNEKFGVCLRPAAPIGGGALADPAKRDDLKQFFADNDLYLYTPTPSSTACSRSQVIKEQVYEPDWATRERTRLHDEGRESARRGRARRHRPVDPERTARLQAARSRARTLWRLHRRTSSASWRTSSSCRRRPGKMVTLGLEPEPRCFLETTDETVEYFKTHLFSGPTAQRLAKPAGINEADAAQAMRDTWASSSTSATSRWATRTSRRRSRSWSMPASRCQAAGSRVDVDARGDAEDGRRAAAVCQDRLPLADVPEEGRQDDLVPESRGRVRGGTRTRARASGARISMCPCSSTISAHLARRVSRSSRRWRSTRRSRSRLTSRSRPTPGTCCRSTSRPATSSSTSRREIDWVKSQGRLTGPLTRSPSPESAQSST